LAKLTNRFVGVALSPANKGEQYRITLQGWGRLDSPLQLKNAFAQVWYYVFGPGIRKRIQRRELAAGGLPLPIYRVLAAWLPPKGTWRLKVNEEIELVPYDPARPDPSVGESPALGDGMGGRPYIACLSASRDSPFVEIVSDSMARIIPGHLERSFFVWDTRLFCSRFSQLLLELREDTVGDPNKAFKELWDEFRPIFKDFLRKYPSLQDFRVKQEGGRVEYPDLWDVFVESILYVARSQTLSEYIQIGPCLLGEKMVRQVFRNRVINFLKSHERQQKIIFREDFQQWSEGDLTEGELETDGLPPLDHVPSMISNDQEIIEKLAIEQVVDQLVQEAPRQNREKARQIYGLIREGHDTATIAKEAGVHETTVRRYRREFWEKWKNAVDPPA